MKRTGKSLAILLALLIVAVGTLTGCSTNGGTTQTTAPGETTTAGSTTTSGSAELKAVDLNFYYPCTPQQDQDAVFEALNKITKEKLNCTLNMKPTDWAQWNNKYPILLSSGEKVDLIYTSFDTGFFQEVGKNSFLALDSLMEKYGQGISSVMQDGYFDAATVKGQLYAIPANKDMGQGWGVCVNKEMADQIGADFSNVKYLEDLEPILAKAKAELSGVTPFFMSTELDLRLLYSATKKGEDSGFRNHTKVVALDDQIAFNLDTGKAMPFYEIPEFVDQCRLARTWFEKGYINKDTIVTQSTCDDTFKNKRAFMFVASTQPGQDKVYEAVYGVKCQTIELMPGIKDTASLTGAMTAIPTACSDPERAMMVLNLAFSDKNFINTFSYGVDGRHFKKISDNVIGLPDGADSMEATGYNPTIWWEMGDNYKLYTWDNEDPEKWNILKDYSANLVKSGLLGFSLDTTNIKTEVAAHKNVISEFNRILICGAADTDETLQKMQAKDKVAGIEKICSEIESQVTAWKSGK